MQVHHLCYGRPVNVPVQQAHTQVQARGKRNSQVYCGEKGHGTRFQGHLVTCSDPNTCNSHLPAVVDLPTPPFAEDTATMCSTSAKPNFLVLGWLEPAALKFLTTLSALLQPNLHANAVLLDPRAALRIPGARCGKLIKKAQFMLQTLFVFTMLYTLNSRSDPTC